MIYLKYALIPIAVSLLLPFIAVAFRKRAAKPLVSKTNCHTFSASKVFSCLLVVISVLYLAFLLVFWIEKWVNPIILILMFSFEIPLIICCIQSFREKIVITNDCVLFTPTFGSTRRIEFEKISRIESKYRARGLIQYIVYADEKKQFVFSNSMRGYQFLLNLFQSKNIVIL